MGWVWCWAPERLPTAGLLWDKNNAKGALVPFVGRGVSGRAVHGKLMEPGNEAILYRSWRLAVELELAGTGLGDCLVCLLILGLNLTVVSHPSGTRWH